MNAPSLPKVPMLDLDVLQTLVSIAETGSFSAAAAQVGRTPSAVSLQVKKVE
ncbi:MAG: helix-turn-helix domain-containing protein, partial [Mangrovicoccus sp.]